MRLEALTVHDFRNIAEADLEPAERITVLHGENGQGKTNLLEAVWFLATLRPLRAQKSAELVRIGCERARVAGTVVEAVTSHLEVTLAHGRREAQIDGKRPATVEAYAETLKVIAFTPDDLEIAKGSPAARRRWLDRAAFTRRGGYLAEHRAYTRALKARNQLLKEGKGGPALAAYDETVCRTGATVLARRLALVDEIGPRIAERWASVTDAEVPLSLGYETGVRPDDGTELPREEAGLARALADTLARRARVDRARGFTTRGPHSDDVALSLDGRPLRSYGSQGQMRAAVLALKIAEIENLRDEAGRTPVLLLDDVSSELDPRRNAKLLAYLGGYPGQVLLTTTDPSLAPLPPGVAARSVRVRAGRLTPG